MAPPMHYLASPLTLFFFLRKKTAILLKDQPGSEKSTS